MNGFKVLLYHMVDEENSKFTLTAEHVAALYYALASFRGEVSFSVSSTTDF